MYATEPRSRQRTWWQNPSRIPAPQAADDGLHPLRTAGLTLLLARFVGIPATELTYIYQGALLHDIGMRGVPSNIPLKPDLLSSEEWELVQQHPVFGRRILEGSGFENPAVLDIPYCHHERWDGHGYPRGLRGERIPLPARLFALADVWDALTSDRPYRAAWTWGETIVYFEDQAGRQFDPHLVDVFCLQVAPSLRTASHGSGGHRPGLAT